MSCPFPGMDPYLGRPAIWPDFHDSLIAYLRESLQPKLRPKYAALTQDRLYVVEHHRPIRPDMSIAGTRNQAASRGAATIELEPDTPLVVEILEEQICQPVLHIVEPAAGNRIVSAIDVLSPENKSRGEGRNSYLRKQDELIRARANLVEFDLLRGGQRTCPRMNGSQNTVAESYYVVAVTRHLPPRFEFYPFSIRDRLPRIGIPLAGNDPDVVVDMQAVFSRCWESGPYPELLEYDDVPPNSLSADDLTWCQTLIRESSKG